jgi:hypothetical protein
MERKRLVTGELAYKGDKKPSTFQKYENTYHQKGFERNGNIQQTVEKLELNLIQRQLFRRLMYGISDFSQEELIALSPQSITQIVLNYEKAKKALHVLKAKKYYHDTNKLMDSVIAANFEKRSEKEYVPKNRDCDWYLPLPKYATLNKLGISTKEIVEDFIRRSLLPKNFFQVSMENIQL